MNGLAEVLPTAPRTGYATIPRGETGFVVNCSPTMVRPKALDGVTVQTCQC